MQVGQGCKVHLISEEVPMQGIHILRVSKHMVAIINGVLHDTHDPQRATHAIYTVPESQTPKPNWRFLQKINTSNQYTSIEHRCVYGYWTLDR